MIEKAVFLFFGLAQRLRLRLFSSLLLDHAVFEIPKLLRKVYVVVMGVVKALDLVPHALQRLLAMGTDLVDRGQLIDLIAILEDGNQKLLGLEIRQSLGLPRVFGICRL